VTERGSRHSSGYGARASDRELFDEMRETLGFLEAGGRCSLRGQAHVGHSNLAKDLGLATLAKGTRSASRGSLQRSRTCSVAIRSPPSNAEGQGQERAPEAARGELPVAGQP
jgi:hypothetical protein